MYLTLTSISLILAAKNVNAHIPVTNHLLVQRPVQNNNKTNNIWIGKYEWVETPGQTTGGTGIVIGHDIEILRNRQGQMVAKLDSSGFQTLESILCDVKISNNGKRISLLFKSHSDSKLVNRFGVEQYKKGDVMLSLEQINRQGKVRYLTYWGAFQPNQSLTTGREYFRKK